MAKRDLSDEGSKQDDSDAARPSSLKRLVPRRLLSRSLLIIVTPLVLLQVISTWIFYDRHYDTITKRLAEGLAGEIAVVIEMIHRAPGELQRAQVFRLAKRSLVLDIELVKGGYLSGDAESPGYGILNNKLNKALGERFGYPFIIDTDSLPDLVRIDIQLPDGVLKILVPRKRLFSSTTYIFIMWMVGTSIILFGVAVFFMRKQVTPIQRLAQAAESFGKGRDVEGFKPEGAAEVRQASAAFLQMRSRIKRQVQQRTDMLSGVSHDLRTPLTRMKLQLAMLDPTPEIGDLQTDVGEMEKMVEGYLAFARGEGAETPVDSDVAELVADVVQSERRHGPPIGYDRPDPGEAALPVRPNALKRAVGNLVQNAKRHGRRVNVTVLRAGDQVEIIVDDDGPGIPADKRAHVFQPFVRLEPSRNPATGGTGLGLTIARDIVRGHGGDVTLEDSPRGGLRAVVRLPV
jgi:two-component system osmolarity sensor histidine kinase EnvZ